MHIYDFVSWFSGFTEEMKGPPSEAQWKRICEEVEKVGNRAMYMATTGTTAYGSNMLGQIMNNQSANNAKAKA